MSTIEIFEASAPARQLADFARANFDSRLRWLESKGVRVQRYTLPGDATWCSINPMVKSAVEAQGADCLPIVTVDESIISVGGYPSPIELMEATGWAPDSDTDLFSLIGAEKAALCAAIEANDFKSFQEKWERLRSLGIGQADLGQVVQSTTANAGSAVVGDPDARRYETGGRGATLTCRRWRIIFRCMAKRKTIVRPKPQERQVPNPPRQLFRQAPVSTTEVCPRTGLWCGPSNGRIEWFLRWILEPERRIS